MIAEIQLDWIEEENKRSEELGCEQTENFNAPRLIKQKKLVKPVRKIKSFFLQTSSSIAFDKLVLKQKIQKEKNKEGKTAPELIEEAIELLVNKYSEK